LHEVNIILSLAEGNKNDMAYQSTQMWLVDWRNYSSILQTAQENIFKLKLIYLFYIEHILQISFNVNVTN